MKSDSVGLLIKVTKDSKLVLFMMWSVAYVPNFLNWPTNKAVIWGLYSHTYKSEFPNLQDDRKLYEIIYKDSFKSKILWNCLCILLGFSMASLKLWKI